MRSPNNKPVRVAITGFDGLDNPHPGTPVARALRAGWNGPIEIDALGYDTHMTGAWMPGIADRVHVMPSAAEGDDTVFERVLEIHAHRPLDAIIPCLDLEIPVYARLSDRLAQAGIRTLLPPVESIYATSKLRLPKFCHDSGFAAPRTIHVLDLSDLALHADQFGYPLMIKGVVAGAKKVNDAAEAQLEAAKLDEKWGGGVLLQEIVIGEEYIAAAIAGPDGECHGLVPVRKLGVNERGKAIFGAVIDDPDIKKTAIKILSRANWRGPLELEFLRPTGSSKIYLVEINCRFPSWIMLSHWAGCNLPVLLLSEILQPNPLTAPTPKAGTSFVRDVAETVVPLTEYRKLQRFGSCTGTTACKPNGHLKQEKGFRVAVSGVSTLDVVNAGLGVARALRQAADVTAIYGLGYGTYDSGLFRSDLFDVTYRLPLSDDPDMLLQRLEAIHGETPFDVVIPCLDGEIPRFIAIRERLETLGIHCLLPDSKAFNQRCKTELFTGGLRADWGDFVIPDTVHARSEEEIVKAARRLGYPVVVKGPISLAIEAKNEEEACAAWGALRKAGCADALVQPFVEGERFAVAVVCGQDHRSLCAMTIKKLHLCDRGSTWSAIGVNEPKLESAFADFMKHIHWVGPGEGEFIRDQTDERFHLIEINPRFTAWIAFSGYTGSNHPYQTIRTALGQAVKPAADTDGLVFMRSCEDIPISTSAFSALVTKGTLRHG